MTWYLRLCIPVTVLGAQQSVGLEATKEHSSPPITYFIKPQHFLGCYYSQSFGSLKKVGEEQLCPRLKTRHQESLEQKRVILTPLWSCEVSALLDDEDCREQDSYRKGTRMHGKVRKLSLVYYCCKKILSELPVVLSKWKGSERKPELPNVTWSKWFCLTLQFPYCSCF